jgi:hypothetical protein
MERVDRGVLKPVPRAVAASKRAAESGVLLSIDFQSVESSAVGGVVTNVAKDGQVQLEIREDMSGRSLAEGLYLGLVIPANARGEMAKASLKVVRATVAEIDDAAIKLQVGPAAAGQIKNGQLIALVRPPGSTTAQLRAVPDMVGTDQPGLPDTLVPARNKLKQIGLAMHNFHATHGCFPPAVVTGPDGKPWHSWRVLILPYLEELKLYNEYDFTVPWGPREQPQGARKDAGCLP